MTSTNEAKNNSVSALALQNNDASDLNDDFSESVARLNLEHRKRSRYLLITELKSIISMTSLSSLGSISADRATIPTKTLVKSKINLFQQHVTSLTTNKRAPFVHLPSKNNALGKSLQHLDINKTNAKKFELSHLSSSSKSVCLNSASATTSSIKSSSNSSLKESTSTVSLSIPKLNASSNAYLSTNDVAKNKNYLNVTMTTANSFLHDQKKNSPTTKSMPLITTIITNGNISPSSSRSSYLSTNDFNYNIDNNKTDDENNQINVIKDLTSEKSRIKHDLATDYGFNEDQIGIFEETFQIFDKDCDGFITLAEIRTVMNALGFYPCDESIRQCIQRIDNDNSGTVDFEEFIGMMSKFRQLKSSNELEQELKEIFNIFDKNMDGFIDKLELKDVLTRLGESITDDEVLDMIREADTDGDNKVSYIEFKSMLYDNKARQLI